MTEMVPIRVTGVYMQQGDAPVAQHFVLFQDEQKRRMPMWLGQFEAWSISYALEGEKPERPFTHDAMLMLLEATGAVMEEARITELRDESFYSIIVLRVGEERKELDVRPSDAVSLALRAKCPIFMAEDVVKRCARTN